MNTQIDNDSITSHVRDALAYCGLAPSRIETYTEATDRNIVSYASLVFKFDQMELLTKSALLVISEQTKNFSDKILGSTLVVTELCNLTNTIDSQKLEITRLQEEVTRLTKFEQHYNVEKSLRHNTDIYGAQGHKVK